MFNTKDISLFVWKKKQKLQLRDLFVVCKNNERMVNDDF